METLFRLKCQEKGLILETSSIPEDRCHLYGDEEKLKQVLTNLLSNAVKFTDSGTVSLNIIPKQNNEFYFEVVDTGKGISEEAQKTIFEPFKQDAEGIEKGGTGLGLAICRRQVLLMGSDLHVSSNIDEGSRFYFTLKLPPGKGKPEPKKKIRKKVVRIAGDHHVKALVADDNSDNRTVLSHLLKNIGVEIIEAENGLVALEKTRKHLPDVIFMDIRMPVMDGREAITKIIEEFGKDRFKIVTITASVMKHDREQFLKLGSHEVVLKPFRANQVFECLKNLLNIEYIYSEKPKKDTEPKASPDMDYSQMHIPKEIHQSLKDAAKQNYVTGIRQSLPLLVASGEEGKMLADNLTLYLKNYDMQKILSILDQVNSK
jgi:CheY-like chemotaxis protein